MSKLAWLLGDQWDDRPHDGARHCPYQFARRNEDLICATLDFEINLGLWHPSDLFDLVRERLRLNQLYKKRCRHFRSYEHASDVSRRTCVDCGTDFNVAQGVYGCRRLDANGKHCGEPTVNPQGWFCSRHLGEKLLKQSGTYARKRGPRPLADWQRGMRDGGVLT